MTALNKCAVTLLGMTVILNGCGGNRVVVRESEESLACIRIDSQSQYDWYLTIENPQSYERFNTRLLPGSTVWCELDGGEYVYTQTVLGEGRKIVFPSTSPACRVSFPQGEMTTLPVQTKGDNVRRRKVDIDKKD